MKSFKDASGRSWNFFWSMSKPCVWSRSVNGITLTDLAGRDGASLIEQIANDPVFLGEVMATLCLPENHTKEDAEKFMEKNLSGDSIEEAATVLMDEIADFFPKARAVLLRKIISMARAQQEAEIKKGDRNDGRPGISERAAFRYERIIDTCYDLAGITGVDPSGFTLRELDKMAMSRLRSEWDQTSSLQATLLNINQAKG